MTQPARPSTPSGPAATSTMKATNHQLQKHDKFTRYQRSGAHVCDFELPFPAQPPCGIASDQAVYE
jgi:hypothetical protein